MYRKNTAGQFVCFQMLLTATGAVATGLSPAVRRCIDGTFAAGGGSVTEDGTTGSYKYAMAQADTNGNDISLIFSAATAMPVCINFVTTAADPTNAASFGITNIDATITSRMATYTQPTGFLAATFPSGTVANTTNITAGTITTVTNLTNAPTAGDLTATMKTSVTTAATAATPTAAAVTGSVGSVTGLTASNLDATISSRLASASYTAPPTAVQNADALLDRDMATGTDSGSATVRTARQALRFLRNKWSIAGTTLTVTKEDDSTTSWTSTVTATPGADPITANDPAGP